MKKKLTIIILTFSLVLTAAIGSAASNKCTVVETEDKKLVLECERGTDQFKPGDAVKIKTVRKGAAIEGC